MKLQRVMAGMLGAVMLAGSMTGCSKPVKESEAGKESITETQSQTGNADGTKTSFTYWLPIHQLTAQSVTDHNDHPAAARLEEQTGMYVDYINPPVGQEKEQMNLLLASGKNLPDLIRFDFAKNYRGGVDGAIKDGVILDATKLIEEHAPNFMARINADEEFKRGAYTDQGALAQFGTILPDKELRGGSYNGPLINKNLLDKAGLEVPVTIADWEEMLASFKEMGVDMPFSFGANKKMGGLFNAFSGAYGVPVGVEFMNRDGVVKFGPMEPGYKEFLMMFNKWYSNGWLDADFLSKQPGKEIRSDFEIGNIGSTVLHRVNIVSVSIVSVKKGREEVTAVAAPYPVLNEGDKIHFRHSMDSFSDTPTFISATAKDPVSIIKWVDYLYSPEGIIETSWGVKDDERFEDTYYIDSSGKMKFTDFIMKNPDGLSLEQVSRQSMMWDIRMTYDRENQLAQFEDPRYQECSDVWESNCDTAYVMPETLTMTIEENDEYSKIMGDVTTYVYEMTTKYIMGIESFDRYDDFLKTLEKMNITRAVEIQQAALDRYMER